MPLFNRSDGVPHYMRVSRVNNGLANKFFRFVDSTGANRIGRVSNLYSTVSLFNPEATLSLSGTVQYNSVFATSNVVDDANAVLAADFINLNGSSGGLIAEMGGSGTGTYAGFDIDGTFVFRFGQGATRWPVNTCYVLVDPGVIAGNGTLVCEIKLGNPARGRVWWNGVLVGQSSRGNIYDWTGSNEGTYMRDAANVTTGHVNTVVSGSASDLRYYAAQTVPE